MQYNIYIYMVNVKNMHINANDVSVMFRLIAQKHHKNV